MNFGIGGRVTQTSGPTDFGFDFDEIFSSVRANVLSLLEPAARANFIPLLEPVRNEYLN